MTLRSARFKHSALLAGGFFATAFTSLFVGGCSFFYDLNTTQCEVDSDCTAFGPQFSNTQCINRVCVAKQSGFGGAGGVGTGGKGNTGGGNSEGGIAASQGGMDVGGTAGLGGDGGMPGEGGTGGSGPPPECITNGDCIDAHVDQPYMCTDGKCIQVTTPSCPVLLPTGKTLEYLRAGTPVMLGGFASMTNPQDPHDTQAIVNWDLAFTEFNEKTFGGITGLNGEQRPLMGLMCQGKVTDTAELVPSMDHLTGDLRVPGILSTLSADNLYSVWKYTQSEEYLASDKPPVMFMSTGSADLRLANEPDNGLIWHMLGDPRVLASTISSLVKRIEPVLKQKRQDAHEAGYLDDPSSDDSLRVTLVHSDDPTMRDVWETLTTPDLDHPDAILQINGKNAIDPANANYFRQVAIESSKYHTPPDVSAAITDLQQHPPHLVIAIATAEFPQRVVPALENFWTKTPTMADASNPTQGMMRPYYLMSHFIYNTPELQTVAAQFSSQTPPLNMRALGVNYAQSQDSHAVDLYLSYLGRLQASYTGTLSLQGTENYYDGAYSLLYAAGAAARRNTLSGTTLRDAFSDKVISTAPGTVSIDIGPGKIVTAMNGFNGSSTYRISLYGTMGKPNFDRLSGTRVSDTSAWCIQKVGSDWAYQADGLIYDPDTGTFKAPSGGVPACLQGY
jgi:hypothetical protein